MDNLKTAVKAFIEEIQRNDLYDKAGNRRLDDNNQPTSLGNQISIVKFAMNYYSGNSATITPGNTFTNLNGTSKGDYSSQNRPYNCTQVRVGFTKTSTNTKTVANPSASALAADVQSLTDAVDGMRAGGATAADYGMTLANMLINSLGSDREGSARTVVFFTDGNPTYGSAFTNSVANSAIANARTIKQSGAEDAHPQIFSVGVFDNSPTPGSNIDNFMNYVSSNYPTATSLTNAGTKDSDKFYTDASSGEVDLTEVFQTIAHAAGGSDKELGQATVSNVDIVSASFTLPPGTVTSDIKLYTAPYTGTKDANGYLIFGDKIPKGSNTATYQVHQKNDDGTVSLVGDPILVDAGLTVALAASQEGGKTDKIIVNGFDYGNNFCGEDITTTGYNGHKVIIEIPIMMDPTAVGGPDVATNAPGSGIYLGDENLIYFESPKVSLPVNLHIRKEGLDEGESAKFTIQRKLVTEGDNAWTDVTSVFVTRRAGQAKEGVNAPVTKVVGMPSVDEQDREFVYRIMEDDWSWSYVTTAATTIYSDQLVTNPFIFTNTKKEGIDYKVRHAESKASNIFKTGVTNVEYDDSKTNTRP